MEIQAKWNIISFGSGSTSYRIPRHPELSETSAIKLVILVLGEKFDIICWAGLEGKRIEISGV